MTENELKREVLRIAKANGWLAYHVTQSKVRGSQGRGYPDLTLARYGTVIWFELKQDGEYLRAEQIAWADTLPEGRHYIIRPADLERVERMLA